MPDSPSYAPILGQLPYADRTRYPGQPVHSQLRIVTPPAVEPVTVQLAKQWMVIEHSQDDYLIQFLITSARESVERWLSRALITQTWGLWLDGFPYEIELRLPPVQSVTWIYYLDVNGVQQTVDSSIYQTDFETEPGRVRPQYGMVWPVYRAGILNPVWLQFVAGYGATGASVPWGINQAILELTALRYRNREPMTVGSDAAAAEQDIRRRVMAHSWGAYA